MSNNNTNAKNNTPHKLPANFSVLTFNTPCVTCGATVEFASAASIMAVCEYCQTTIVRDGDTVHSQGKQSLALEDYSPLQIGSVGEFQKISFAVVGRIQLEYAEGIWNEWYLQFSNGHNGWLSEAGGQYSLMLDKGKQPLPSYEQLTVNQRVVFAEKSYVVTDKRTALAIAGQGELPFIMGSGWQTWVIDARNKRQFITLDYSDGIDVEPTVFKGVSISLEQLSMQFLKDDRQTNEEAGLSNHHHGGINQVKLNDFEQMRAAGGAGSGGASLEGALYGIDKNSIKPDQTLPLESNRRKMDDKVTNLDCPNCGSPVPFVAGITNCLMCPACFSEIKMTGKQAEIVKINSLMQNYVSTLQLGAKARIKEVDLVDVTEFSEDGIDEEISFDDDFGQDHTSKKQNQSKNSAKPKKKKAISPTKYHDYVVVGVQRLQEIESFGRWTEYLLYSFTDGFLWLSEEPENGWMISRVLNDFPNKLENGIVYDGQLWKSREGFYQSRVIFAIGAFSWQVKVNDFMVLTDYYNGSRVITAEQNNEEITYTLASAVSDKQMKTWFGSQLAVEKKQRSKHENLSKYNLENNSSSIHNEGEVVSILHLIGGLCLAYIFCFMGSAGAFFWFVFAFIIGCVYLGVITRDKHDYESFYDTSKYALNEASEGSKIGIWVIIGVFVIVGFMLFPTSLFQDDDNHSSYYYNNGRSGYSSYGSHK